MTGSKFSFKHLCIFRKRTPLRFGFSELIREQWDIYVVRVVLLAILIWLSGSHIYVWLAVVLLEAYMWAITYKTRAHEPHIFRLTNDERLFEFVPNISYSYYYPARNFWGQDSVTPVKIGPHGLRIPEDDYQPTEADFRILVLGDSATLGEGVSFRETYPAVFERELNARLGAGQAVSVVNAGVPGYNTMQAVASLPGLLATFKPKAVLLAVTLEDSLEWGRIRIGDDGEMVRLDAPPRHRVREYLKRLSYVLYQLSQIYRFIRAESYVNSLFSDTYSGYRRWVDAVGRMSSLCRANGAIAVATVVPGLWRLQSYPWRHVHTKIESVLTSAGIEVIDLLPAFEGLPDEELWVHPKDLHPNADAHRIIGRGLAEGCVGIPSITGLREQR